MDKSHFRPDTRYVVTLHDDKGGVRPANLYVYRLYDKFMVARSMSGDGLLRKIGYDAVERVVDESPVAPAERFFVPAALLEESNWRDKSEMQVYASAPGRGK
jgi:hypothetical protein